MSELNAVEGDTVDMLSLRAANLITETVNTVKIFQSGEVKKAVTVKGLRVSKGARAAIEAAGGKVED